MRAKPPAKVRIIMSQPIEPSAHSPSVSLKEYELSDTVPEEPIADFPSVSLKDYDISGSVPEAIDSESVETLPYDESEMHEDAKDEDFYNMNRILLAGSIILIGIAACLSGFNSSNTTSSNYIMQHHYN